MAVPRIPQAATGVVGFSTLCCGQGGNFNGYTAESGSNQRGGAGVGAYGGNGDPSDTLSNGGDGVDATGGSGGDFAGAGINAMGGRAYPGNGAGIDGPGGVFSGGGSTGDGIEVFSCSLCANAVFNGSIIVTGAVTTATKDFKVDHPLDPANKYLVHASVESSEMKNIYDGVVTTDALGEATVHLPDWFEVLNSDFRYQLTVIGQFAQAIVSHEIEAHQFQIRTNLPNVKVLVAKSPVYVTTRSLMHTHWWWRKKKMHGCAASIFILSCTVRRRRNRSNGRAIRR